MSSDEDAAVESDDSDKKPKKKTIKKIKDEETKDATAAPNKKFGAPPTKKFNTFNENTDPKIPSKKASNLEISNHPPLIEIELGGSQTMQATNITNDWSNWGAFDN